MAVLATAAAAAASSASAAASASGRFPLIPGANRVEEPAPIAAPSRQLGGTLAGIVAPAEARARPGAGGNVWRVGPATSWTGQPQVLLVLDSAEQDGHEWIRVLLPIRPVGASGWIPRDNAVLMKTPYWVTIDKSLRRVTVFRAGRRVRSFRAVVGKPATPTRNGLAAIYEKDRQPDPRAFLGPWALTLTALSNVLRNFGGGPGRGGDPRPCRCQPSRSPRLRPLARLHPHRQRPDQVDGPAYPTRHAGRNQGLAQTARVGPRASPQTPVGLSRADART